MLLQFIRNQRCLGLESNSDSACERSQDYSQKLREILPDSSYGIGYVTRLCGFFFLDLLAGIVRSGEKRGQQWSEVVSDKINKIWNVMTLSWLLFPGD